MALKFDMSGSNWKDDYFRKMAERESATSPYNIGKEIGVGLGHIGGVLGDWYKKNVSKVGKAYKNYLATTPDEQPEAFDMFALDYEGKEKKKQAENIEKRKFEKFGPSTGPILEEGSQRKMDILYSDRPEDEQSLSEKDWFAKHRLDDDVKEAIGGIRKEKRKDWIKGSPLGNLFKKDEVIEDKKEVSYLEEMEETPEKLPSTHPVNILKDYFPETQKTKDEGRFIPGKGRRKKTLLGMVQRFLPGGQTGFKPTPTLMGNYPAQQYGQDFRATPLGGAGRMDFGTIPLQYHSRDIGTGPTDFGVNPTYQNQGGESWRDYASSLVLNPPLISEDEEQYEGPYNPDYNNESPLRGY